MILLLRFFSVWYFFVGSLFLSCFFFVFDSEVVLVLFGCVWSFLRCVFWFALFVVAQHCWALTSGVGE